VITKSVLKPIPKTLNWPTRRPKKAKIYEVLTEVFTKNNLKAGFTEKTKPNKEWMLFVIATLDSKNSIFKLVPEAKKPQTNNKKQKTADAVTIDLEETPPVIN